MKVCVSRYVALLLSLVVIDCGGSNEPRFTPPPALVSITITPASLIIPKGLTQQFSATGILNDGRTQRLTNTAWTSSDSTIASIDGQGLATTKAVGVVTITATSGGISGTAKLEVGAAEITSITIAPDAASVVITKNQQFTAGAMLTDGTRLDVTSSAAWSVSDPAIASVTSAGLLTTMARGTVSISATENGITGQALVSASPGILMKLPLWADQFVSPRISNGGRFILFESLSDQHVWVLDTCFGTSSGCTPGAILASIAPDGSTTTGIGNHALDSTGRYVLFVGVDAYSYNQYTPFLRDTCISATQDCVPNTLLISTDVPTLPQGSGIVEAAFGETPRYVYFSYPPYFPGEGAPVPFFQRDTCIGATLQCMPSTNIVYTGYAAYNWELNIGIPPKLSSVSGNGRYIALALFSGLYGMPLQDHYGLVVWDTCANAAANCQSQLYPDFETTLFGWDRGSSALSYTGRYFSVLAEYWPIVEAHDSCLSADSTCEPAALVANVDNDGHALTPYGTAAITTDGRFVSVSRSAYRDTCFGADASCSPNTIHLDLTFNGNEIPDGRVSISPDGKFAVFTGCPGDQISGTCAQDIYVAILALNGN